MKQKRSPPPAPTRSRRAFVLFGLLAAVFVIGGVGGLIYWEYTQGRVYVEKAEIFAPPISLSASRPGTLDSLFVSEGDHVLKNQILAFVGGEPVRAKTNGEIIAVTDTIGQTIGPTVPLIKMIDSSDARLIGHLEEDKGLRYVRAGMNATFTMDAFPGKTYAGVVDSVSPAARQGDIVFSISDKREERQFDIKVSFDADAYPELKQGMSAKLWIIR